MNSETRNFYNISGDLDKAIKLTQDISILFNSGFSKLIQKEKATLDQLAEGFVSSPLRDIVPQGIHKLQKADFQKENFTALVLAITSVQGAIHDALYEEAEKLLGREGSFLPQESSIGFEEHNKETSVLLDNIQNWLIDIAIRGFSDLNIESIQSFENVLQTVEDHQDLKRLGVILRGLSNEFILVLSQTKEENYPINARWMDLWCKAYLLTIKKQVPTIGKRIKGKLKLIALQTHVHRNFLTIVFNGILENKKEKTYVEIEKSKFIIDLIPLVEFWNQMKQENKDLFSSLLSSKIIQINEGMLHQGGNLVLKNYQLTSEAFDLLETIQKSVVEDSLSLSKIQALDRHPVHFKFPHTLKEVDVQKQSVKIDDKEIPIRFDLQPTKKNLNTFLKGCALMELRFDNGWFFKPLTSSGTTNEFLGQISEILVPATPIYSLLKERSSKILRDKK